MDHDDRQRAADHTVIGARLSLSSVRRRQEFYRLVSASEVPTARCDNGCRRWQATPETCQRMFVGVPTPACDRPPRCCCQLGFVVGSKNVVLAEYLGSGDAWT
jgi:hypothetical protein